MLSLYYGTVLNRSQNCQQRTVLNHGKRGRDPIYFSIHLFYLVGHLRCAQDYFTSTTAVGGNRAVPKGKPTTIRRVVEDRPTYGRRVIRHMLVLNSQLPHWGVAFK